MHQRWIVANACRREALSFGHSDAAPSDHYVGWSPAGDYDVVVIGGGAAGLTAAGLAASLATSAAFRIPRSIAYPTLSPGARRVAAQWYVQNTSPALMRAVMALRGLRGKATRATETGRDRLTPPSACRSPCLCDRERREQLLSTC